MNPFTPSTFPIIPNPGTQDYFDMIDRITKNTMMDCEKLREDNEDAEREHQALLDHNE